MKRIDINTQKPNFIVCWDLENKTLCDEIVTFFQSNKNLYKEGVTTLGKNIEAKKTTDITIAPKDLEKPKFEIFKKYFNELHKCYVDYQQQWPFVKSIFSSVDIGVFNIQKYNPGDHFSHLHCERTSLNSLHRLFAFMTYLNDVEDGGKTNFNYYGIQVKPEKGKTLIWPAEWTHAHTGEVLKSGIKYIVTGWLHLPVPKLK